MGKEVTIVEQAGDTWERNLKFTDQNDNNIDITGWTIVLTIKEQRSDADSDALFQKTVTSHNNATAGETSVTLTATETEDLLGDYWYDIKYKTDSGVVDTILAGVFRFEDSITDSI